LKRSLTQKETPMSPRLVDTPKLDKQLNTKAENAAKNASPEGLRRPRPSAMLSLAALSMGATAGVLLSGHGDEARAAETDLSQRPLPSEASGNPFAAAVNPEATATPEVTVDRTPLVAQPELVQDQNVIEHTIQSGDTLWTLSQTYQVSADAIAASNPVEVQGTLAPGQTLKIPRSNFQIQPSPPVAQANAPQSFSSVSTATPKPEFPKVVTDEALEPANSSLNTAKLQTKPTPKVIAQTDETTVESESTVNANGTVAPIDSEVALTQPIPIEVETPSFEPPARFSEPVVIPVPPPQTVVSAPTALPESGNTTATTLVPEVASREIPVATESDTLATPQLLVPVEDNAQVYRVQSGDTIDAIALRYGVSRSDITEVNHLINPHEIRIDQELKIPQPQSLRADRDRYETLIPNGEIANRETRVESPTPSESVVVPTETLVAQTVDSVENWQPITVPSPEIANAQNQNADAETETTTVASNPYVERLKADIERMREEYRTQRQNPEQAETPLANLSGSRSAATTTPVTTTIEQANPEWQTDRNNGTLEVRIEDRRQPLTAPQLQARPQAQPLNPSNQSVQVASAPTTPGNYNPLLQVPNGQQVEPNLPPLSPDRYLPDSPPQFNGYMWPAKGVLTSGYGRRWGRMHRGIDIAGPTGTPIVAAATGEIISAGWNSGGYGNLVDIRHPDGSMTRYAHNSKILVRKGQWVQQGEQIALMGSTGYSTGPHLHFEVHPNGSGAANPMAYLPGR
jgi:murein DD-endopeptidase MepM/ murein hydrolase activator NlpD